MTILTQENKRSFYGYLFLLYRRILNNKQGNINGNNKKMQL